MKTKQIFFFSIEGNLIGDPEERQITNLQLLEALFHSVPSVDCSDLPNDCIKHIEETYHIVLGTFLDEVQKCNFSCETLETKNEILWTKLKKFSSVLIKHCKVGNKIIFPVNAMSRGDIELKMASGICNKIRQHYIEAEIPVCWYLFQLELD